MKIALASDVHLEFGQLEINNTDNADVLILSGDICVACELNDRDVHKLLGEHNRSYRYHSFFEHCAEQFEQVIYIAGNHEHYQGDYALTVFDRGLINIPLEIIGVLLILWTRKQLINDQVSQP